MVKFIGFRVIWDVQGEEEGDILTDGKNLREGLIYWRRDQILGFNSGGEPERTQLILETATDENGNVLRATFTVDEPIDEVAKKLNGQD